MPARSPHPNLRPGRDYLPGTRNPYRPCPPGFREVYIRLGCEKAINEHYRANWATIRRWVEESGGDELRLARSAVSGHALKPRLRTKLPTYAEAVARLSLARPDVERDGGGDRNPVEADG